MTTATPWTMPGPGWLFCPADRPERFAKAANAADVVIIDLEDAVSPPEKPRARQAIVDAFARGDLDVETTVVRVDAASSEHFADDVACLAQTPVRRVMLAKSETTADVDALASALPDAGVIALIESPLGAVNAVEIAAAENVVGLMWGSEDLTAGLGGLSERDCIPDEVTPHERHRATSTPSGLFFPWGAASYVGLRRFSRSARSST